MSAICPRCGADADEDARFCQTCGAAIGDGEVELVGKVLARKYRVVEEIGEGSMGRIFRAEHLGLEKRVALKVLHREVVLGAEGLQRFRREGVAAGKLSHPNAIEVYDFDVTEAGDAFLAMEFVEGRDLRTVLEQEGPQSLDRARDIVLQGLDALEHAHKQGIVHRDLKPENIMLVERDGGVVVKVLDFGLSKLIDNRLEASLATVPGRIIGTPYYMAPEQSSGEEADARTDLYAMGVIFYELLAGQRPFTGRNLSELLYAQSTQEVPSILDLASERGLPEWVDAFIDRALARQREDRYQSAGAMADDLENGAVTASDSPPQERVPTPRPSAHRRVPKSAAPARSKRPKWLVPAIVGGVAAVAIVAVAMLMGGSSGGTNSSSGGQVASSDAARVRQKPITSRTPGEEAYLRFLDGARTNIASGNLAAAEGMITSAMAMPERDPEAYFLRAKTQVQRGDRDGAAADLAAAINADATFVDAHSDLGWLELERGNVDDASTAFEAALVIDASHAGALAGRGAVLAERGDPDAASKQFDDAITRDAESWRAHLGRARIALVRGDTEAAIDSFVQAKRVRPRRKEILVGLGRAYLVADRGADAVTQFEAALELDDADVDVLRNLVAAHFSLDQHRNAVRLLTQNDAAATDAELLGLLGTARVHLGEDEQAVEALRSAVDAGTTDPRAHALLATLELAAGDPTAAVRAATQATKLDENSADAHLARGLALFRLERYEAAEKSLRRAVECDGECLPALLALGDLGTNYLLDGSKAVDDLRAYRDAGGEDPRARRWLNELGVD